MFPSTFGAWVSYSVLMHIHHVSEKSRFVTWWDDSGSWCGSGTNSEKIENYPYWISLFFSSTWRWRAGSSCQLTSYQSNRLQRILLHHHLENCSTYLQFNFTAWLQSQLQIMKEWIRTYCVTPLLLFWIHISVLYLWISYNSGFSPSDLLIDHC